MFDLVPAGGAVGDDDGGFRFFADGREERQLAHLHRDVVGVGAVAEDAGHAAAAGIDELDLEAGDQVQC